MFPSKEPHNRLELFHPHIVETLTPQVVEDMTLQIMTRRLSLMLHVLGKVVVTISLNA
jgi:hypothetical protein